MGDRRVEEFVRYLAEHGVDDDQCRQLQKLVDDGRASEIQAHLSSWVKRCARDVLAGKEADRNDLDISEVVYRVTEDVAGLYIEMDAGVQKVLADLSDETLKALVQHFERKTPETRIQLKVMRAAKTELSLRWHFKKAKAAIQGGAPSYCVHHQCDSRECAKKH